MFPAKFVNLQLKINLTLNNWQEHERHSEVYVGEGVEYGKTIF
jgi:hypothetical protein